MLRTLEHFVHPRPVTRKYPYEKRDLPERSRGLIALLLEPETSIFKCESCLMCEKACPPRAISISYRFRDGFRKRPPLAPRASYYRIRMVQTAPYGDRRPMSTAVTTIPAEDERVDLGPVRRILRETPEGADRLTRVLYSTNAAYGYLPWTAAELIAAEFGKTMTDLYTTASLLANFRGAPPGRGTAVPRGGRRYTGNVAIAGAWPEASPAPAHDKLREAEVRHVVDAKEAFIYLHPGATEARAAVERAIADHQDELGIAIEVALGPGGFMGGEESALLAVLESRRAMARQRPPYPASQGLNLRPTLVSSIETLAWLPLVVEEQVRASTKLVSVTGAVSHPGVYEVALGTSLGDIVSEAGGTTAKLKGLHVGGPTGGILNATRSDTRFDFDDLRVAGAHMRSAQVRAIPVGTCIVNEAAKLFAYLARESCAICVPCRVGTKRVQGILEGMYSGLGRDSDLPWLDELGDHMERFSLCGFGITAPSILRTTMREFPDDYRIHIQDMRCPEGSCTPVRSRRYETMAQP